MKILSANQLASFSLPSLSRRGILRILSDLAQDSGIKQIIHDNIVGLRLIEFLLTEDLPDKEIIR